MSFTRREEFAERRIRFQTKRRQQRDLLLFLKRYKLVPVALPRQRIQIGNARRLKLPPRMGSATIALSINKATPASFAPGVSERGMMRSAQRFHRAEFFRLKKRRFRWGRYFHRGSYMSGVPVDLPPPSFPEQK